MMARGVEQKDFKRSPVVSLYWYDQALASFEAIDTTLRFRTTMTTAKRIVNLPYRLLREESQQSA